MDATSLGLIWHTRKTVGYMETLTPHASGHESEPGRHMTASYDTLECEWRLYDGSRLVTVGTGNMPTVADAIAMCEQGEGPYVRDGFAPGQPTDGSFTRDEAILALRHHLRLRSDREWRVTAGRGKHYDRITIHAPRERRAGMFMPPGDRAELGRVLSLGGPAHPAGVQMFVVRGQFGSRFREFLDRAAGIEHHPYEHQGDD